MNAMTVIPRLYRVGSFDSLGTAVAIWEQSCGEVAEVKITKILLDIQTDKFTVSNDLDPSSIYTLNEYAQFFSL